LSTLGDIDDLEITLPSKVKLVEKCVLLTKSSAAAEQQKLQFFRSTFRQKHPTYNPKTQAPSTTKTKMASNEARSIFPYWEKNKHRLSSSLGKIFTKK